jgi:hypothetical protein
VNYIAQHDCATRRGNDFRRRNTKSLRITCWRKLVHQSSEKNIFERNRKNRPFSITWCAQKCSEASGGTLLCDIICAEAPLQPPSLPDSLQKHGQYIQTVFYVVKFSAAFIQIAFCEK